MDIRVVKAEDVERLAAEFGQKSRHPSILLSEQRVYARAETDLHQLVAYRGFQVDDEALS